MQTLDIIQKLCKENGVTIAKLERDLGFSNGSLKKSKSIKNDRLREIAQYFHVSMEYLVTGSNTPTPPRNSILYDPEFLDWMKRLYALPDECRQAIYEQISLQELKQEKSVKEKEARSGA